MPAPVRTKSLDSERSEGALLSSLFWRIMTSLYQRIRAPSLRPGPAEKAAKSPSILHANAGVNATDLTETALRTEDAWNPTVLPARLGLCFCAKGMNG